MTALPGVGERIGADVGRDVDAVAGNQHRHEAALVRLAANSSNSVCLIDATVATLVGLVTICLEHETGQTFHARIRAGVTSARDCRSPRAGPGRRTDRRIRSDPPGAQIRPSMRSV